MTAPTFYGLKRQLMRPLVWVRRRGSAEETPRTRDLLEQFGYSSAVRTLMAAKAIDPDVLHRCDLHDQSITFDVGAYLGDGAAGIRRLYGGTVYALEPNPGIFERLAERFADDPKVITLPYGLGNCDATLSLALDGPGSSVLGRTQRDWVTAEVQIRDIVGVLDEQQRLEIVAEIMRQRSCEGAGT